MSDSGALRVVVDSNLFVSGLISPSGRPSKLLDAWYRRRFALVLSEQQYDELTDVFSRPKFVENPRITTDRLIRLFAELAIATRVVPSAITPVPVRDPDDEHILATALGGN